MDKILLIDAHNQLWRASIGFGPQKQIHTECTTTCNHKFSYIRENFLSVKKIFIPKWEGIRDYINILVRI